MKKLVISLLLSLVLVVSLPVGYSQAELKIDNTYSYHHKCYIKLEEKAKEMGITVDELKAKMKAEHQAKLEEKAKQLGITVDELKAKRQAECQAKLEKKAQELGITVDQLRAERQADRQAKLEKKSTRVRYNCRRAQEQNRDSAVEHFTRMVKSAPNKFSLSM